MAAVVIVLLLNVALLVGSWLILSWTLSDHPAFLCVRRRLCRTLGHLRLDGLDDLWGECSVCLAPLGKDGLP